MATSEVGLCNMALTGIGAGTIASLDEGSKASIACAQFFDMARDAALRDHDWNFARRRKTLAETGSTTEGWAYEYGYPSDCLALRELVNPFSERLRIDFEIARNGDGNRVVLTDMEEAEAVYTARVTDPAAFDPLFVEAFFWRLAGLIAWPVTGRSTNVDLAQKMYATALSAAATANAREAHARHPVVSDWMAARGAAPWGRI